MDTPKLAGKSEPCPTCKFGGMRLILEPAPHWVCPKCFDVNQPTKVKRERKLRVRSD